MQRPQFTLPTVLRGPRSDTLTTEGATRAGGHTHKLRVPSAATSYLCSSNTLGRQLLCTGTGGEFSNASPVPAATTINLLEASMKNNSRPSRRHLGPTPPDVETRRFPAFPTDWT